MRPLARRRRRGALAVIQSDCNAQYHAAQEAARSKPNCDNGATVAVEHGKARCHVAARVTVTWDQHETVEECVGHRIGRQQTA